MGNHIIFNRAQGRLKARANGALAPGGNFKWVIRDGKNIMDLLFFSYYLYNTY